jgi:hypothetical protein
MRMARYCKYKYLPLSIDQSYTLLLLNSLFRAFKAILTSVPFNRL